MRIAVLDLGTNTFHLLIADVKGDGTWEKVFGKKITVKLGQGGIHRNLIADQPYQRGISAIAAFRKSIDHFEVERIHAFGTASIRNADNGKDFLSELWNDYGIRVGSISGDEEAELIYLGVSQAVELGADYSLIMDIGGGSTEFMIANAEKIHWKQSYKLGASLLLEVFRPSDPIKPEELKKIQTHLNEQLKDLLAACVLYQPVQLIGSAGSFETFASMLHHRDTESQSHYGKKEFPISFKNYLRLHSDLVNSTRAERRQMRGLIKMRIDLIVLASILLKFVLDKTGLQQIKLSAYSLKEGAALRFSKTD